MLTKTLLLMTKKEILLKLDELKIDYSFNETNQELSKIKFIIVGDNPGEREFLYQEYFVGPSGQKLRRHFIENELVKDFDTECLICNKTFIHSNKTKELNQIKTKIGPYLFKTIQQLCAYEIIELSKITGAPILIFGKSELGSKKLFEDFWLKIIEYNNGKENIFVFNHPSFDNFTKEWQKFRKTNKKASNLELLIEIGKANASKINLGFNK